MINKDTNTSTSHMVLLRHGETQWNRIGRYQGQQNSPMSLTGIGQIRAIAHTLRPHIGKLDTYQLWSSPLTRARQSVSILCEELGLSYDAVCFDERLMERSYGRWEGKTMDEIAARFPDDVLQEQKNRWTFAIPGGGESFAHVADRLQSWRDQLPSPHSTIIMAHGGSGRVLRGLCTGLSPKQIFDCNEPQSTAFLISNGISKTLNAEIRYLQKFGCANAGLG